MHSTSSRGARQILAATRSLLAAAAAAVSLAACDIKSTGPGGASGSDGWKVAVGEKLPPFKLQTADGQQVSLEDYAGRPVVMSLFATWCPPCREELPHIENRIWQPMKDQGVQVVAVSLGEEAGTVQNFLRQMPLSFPVLLDKEEKYTGSLADSGIPRLIVTDRDHVIKHLELGFYPPRFAEIVKDVKELAGGEEPGAPAKQ